MKYSREARDLRLGSSLSNLGDCPSLRPPMLYQLLALPSAFPVNQLILWNTTDANLTYILGDWPVAADQHASPTAVVQNSRLDDQLASLMSLMPVSADLCFIRTWRTSKLGSSDVRIGSPDVHNIWSSFICSTMVECTSISALCQLTGSTIWVGERERTLYPLIFDPTPLIAHVHELIIQCQSLQAGNTRSSHDPVGIDDPSSSI